MGQTEGESLDELDELDDTTEEERPSGLIGVIREFLTSWTPAILAVLFIRSFIFEPFRIPSGSMVPSLLIGDHVLVTKFSYGLWVPYTGVEIPFLDSLKVIPRFELMDFGDPQRGDIIVFRFPRDESLNYIKRVVGLPGEKIRVQNNQIFINGVAQPREYLDSYDFIDDSCRSQETKHYEEDLGGVKHDILTNRMSGLRANKAEVTIPEGHVFVMGDNRDNSEDSRGWGFVRYDQIKGRAHFVWLSWNHCQDEVGTIRTDRFMHWLYE